MRTRPFHLHFAIRVICITLSGIVFQQAATAQTSLEEIAQKVGIRVLTQGVSGDAPKSEAVKAIPFNRLNDYGKQRINGVLNNLAQHRSLPSLQYVVHPQMYEYLVQNPDVAVSSWRAMGISRFQMWQTGPFDYEVSAADGSEGITDVIYRDANTCLLICDGVYNSPLLPKSIEASALLLLRYKFVKSSEGSMLVDQKLDAFVAFPSNTAQAVAKLASPVTNLIMDRNLFEVSLYARMMSRAAETEPEWVEHLAQQLDGVLPQRRTELAGIVEKVPRVSQVSDSRADIGKSRQFKIFESSLSRVEAISPPPQPTRAAPDSRLQKSAPERSSDGRSLRIVPATRLDSQDAVSGSVKQTSQVVEQARSTDGEKWTARDTGGQSSSTTISPGRRSVKNTDLFELQDIIP
jgi:hypothetical protein